MDTVTFIWHSIRVHVTRVNYLSYKKQTKFGASLLTHFASPPPLPWTVLTQL